MRVSCLNIQRNTSTLRIICIPIDITTLKDLEMLCIVLINIRFTILDIIVKLIQVLLFIDIVITTIAVLKLCLVCLNIID